MVECKVPECRKRAVFGIEKKQPLRCKSHILPGYKDVVNRKCIYIDKKDCPEGCQTQPSFGIPGTKIGVYCQHHAIDGYVNIKMKYCPFCEQDGIYKVGIFGTRGEKIRYCRRHKQPFHIDLSHPMCIVCGLVRPSYGAKGSRKLTYCYAHRENKDDKNLVSDRCIICSTVATYGIKGEKKALYCTSHKDPKIHVDVKHRMCMFEDCGLRPSFGLEEDKIALFCSGHCNKLIHTNVANRKCKYPGCSTFPSYGKKNGKTVHCSKHKDDEEINLITKRCEFENCETIPIYGSIIDKKPRFCTIHKQYDSVDVKHDNCLYLGCTSRPRYGDFEDRVAIFCWKHRHPNHENVADKLCVGGESICKGNVLYGYPGFTPSHCKNHKQAGQMVKSKSKCQNPECKSPAFFGITYPMFCEDHKKKNHKDLINKNCKSCNLPNVLDLNLLCQYCNPETFKRVYLKKQNKVKDYLDKYLCNTSKYISYDKIIYGGYCGKERPDFFFDFGTFILVLEVDENQHKDRPKECEYARMINIFHSFGMKTLFIRYNPDKYKSNLNKYAKGIERRINLLKEINYWKDNSDKIDSLCSAVYMYFDNDNPMEWRNPEDLLPRIDGLIKDGEEREEKFSNKKRTKINSNIITNIKINKKSTTIKPTTIKPTINKPTTIKPTNIKPTTTKPTTTRPTINKTTINKPTINKTTINKPTINKTTINKSTIDKPAINKTAINKKHFEIKFNNKIFYSYHEALLCE